LTETRASGRLPPFLMSRDRGHPRHRSVARALVPFGAFAAVGAWSIDAAAYRPFDGTDAAVAELYDFEFEIGPVGYLRDDLGPALIAPAIVVNAGVLDDLELVGEGRNLIRFAPGKSAHDELSEAAFNVKYVVRGGVLQDRSGPSIAAELAFLIPGRSDQKAGIGLRTIVSERGAPGAIHLNLEGGLDRFKRGFVEGGVILEGPERWAARPVAELTIEYHAGEEVIAGALLGMLWPVRETFVIDAAARISHEGDVGVAGEVRAGFTWTLPFAHRPEKKPEPQPKASTNAR
jgi:hypothetical protein